MQKIYIHNKESGVLKMEVNSIDHNGIARIRIEKVYGNWFFPNSYSLTFEEANEKWLELMEKKIKKTEKKLANLQKHLEKGKTTFYE